MNWWVRLLLWLLDRTRFAADVAGVADMELDEELDDPCYTVVDWLEYCYLISDDSLPAGDEATERHPPGG